MFQLIYESQIKRNTVMSWSSQKKKASIFRMIEQDKKLEKKV